MNYSLRSKVQILDFAELPSHNRHHNKNDVSAAQVLQGVNLVNSPPSSPDFSEMDCPLWVHERPVELSHCPFWSDYGILVAENEVKFFFDPLYRYSRGEMDSYYAERIRCDTEFMKLVLQQCIEHNDFCSFDLLYDEGLLLLNPEMYNQGNYKGVLLLSYQFN